jgi:hypothetical protein
MVRKREKFKKRREMPRLTMSAILVLTAVTIVSFVLVLFSTGIIQPYFGGSSQTTPSAQAINTIGTAISASSMFYDYSYSPTKAAINFTQQYVYVLGNVSSVENKGGDYRSCIAPSESYLYGCGYVSEMSGWIVWTWNGATQASKVPVDTDFIAECYVIGWNVGDLYLDSCNVVQS